MKDRHRCLKSSSSSCPRRSASSLAARAQRLLRINEEQVKWFEERGCTQYKVEAKPGDLILWDSRTMHHAAFPMGNEIRTVIYTCFAPASQISPEDLAKKQELFNRWEAPLTGRTATCSARVSQEGWQARVGRDLPSRARRADREPIITEQIKKLAGLIPY